MKKIKFNRNLLKFIKTQLKIGQIFIIRQYWCITTGTTDTTNHMFVATN